MSAIATIVATATAVPPHSATQDQVKAAFAELLALSPKRLAAVMAIFDNSQIERRHSVYPLQAVGQRRALTDTMRDYRQHAITLGRDVAARALADARLTAADIDLFITVSCTGIMIPSLDAYLAGEMGFRSDVRRLPITELGCFGGAAALARARDFLCGFPEANVLVVAVELPSLSLQLEDLSLDNLVSSALFGDGAAAVVMRGGASANNAAADNASANRPTGGVRVVETLSHIFPNSTNALGFDLQTDGFHCVLSKTVPVLLKSEIATLVDNLTRRAGLTRHDLTCFVLHPGGKRILGCVEEELLLTRDDTQPSWDVLRDYGNQSSASVLFVLHEWITKRRPPSGAYGLMAAFGPGLSTELLLLQWS
ncbi:MAG TPA: 3-oxoacyl-[acyl-carrier-protein] synthase III C-terminal domain-containing protein [Polyangia bacterium]|nr:3-oxoacyl-[acyl-carrier-protein] synthase III C-terminal domain-containing protein [Polyangia bacterium]